MSDYLSRIAAKSLNLTTVVQPRLASVFESAPNSMHSSDLPSEGSEILEIEGVVEQASPSSSATMGRTATNPLSPESPHNPDRVAATFLPSPSPTPIPNISSFPESSPPAAEALSSKWAVSDSSSFPLDDLQANQAPVTPKSPQSQPAISHLPAPEPNRLTSSPSKPESPSSERQTSSPSKPTSPPSERPTSLPSKPTSPLSERQLLVPTQPPIQPHTFFSSEQRISPPPVNRLSPPTIHISIGRIDVRAIATPTPTPSRRPSQPHQPKLTLEDYLRSRSPGGSRRGGMP